jgi:hypothetical protein
MNPYMWDLIISVPIMAILLKCKLTSVFSLMEPSMNLHASPCDKNGQVNQGVTGTLMQFRNWKRLLRSSVDHYGKYRFARLRIVSLQDYKVEWSIRNRPDKSILERSKAYICVMPFLLSQSLLWVQNHSVFYIISRHAHWHHSCAVLRYGSLKVLPFSKCEGYRAWCVSIPTSSALR